MWGGRFSEPPSEALWRFTVDHSDRRLLQDDIDGSLAHVAMLGEVGILGGDDVEAISNGLRSIGTEAAGGTFEFTDSDEDVHSAVERRLFELIGEPAGRLHTGRSRNDQIALDIRLYLRRTARERTHDLVALASLTADLSDRVGDMVVPAYTHVDGWCSPLVFDGIVDVNASNLGFAGVAAADDGDRTIGVTPLVVGQTNRKQRRGRAVTRMQERIHHPRTELAAGAPLRREVGVE